MQIYIVNYLWRRCGFCEDILLSFLTIFLVLGVVSIRPVCDTLIALFLIALFEWTKGGSMLYRSAASLNGKSGLMAREVRTPWRRGPSRLQNYAWI